MAAAPLMEQGIDTGTNTITAICQSFRQFLSHFNDHTQPRSIDGHFIDQGRYVRQANDMARTQTTTLYVNYQHLDPKDFDPEPDQDDDDMSESQSTRPQQQRYRRFFQHDQLEWFLTHYHSLEPHLCNTLRDFLGEVVPEYVSKDDPRTFSVSIFNFPSTLTVRQLQPEQVGRLVAIRAMATKSTKVSPEVSVGAFQCRDCHAVIKNIKQDFKITLPTQCVTPECTNKRFFDILPEYSRFTDWQQFTVQESTEQLPAGSVPRTVKVVLRGELVEVAKPGDQCVITGVLISIPDVSQLYSRTEHRTSDSRDGDNPRIRGLKDLGVREMSYKTAFLASNITRISGTGATPYPDSLVARLDGTPDFQASTHHFYEQEIQSINAIKNKPNLSQILINSIAPNVFGHDLVKKGILFMILGGVHKVTKDRTSLRGDINVLLIGDPSTAKSQFLKFVAEFLPRVVYTSGKASTAAGLTASVTRDIDTGEFVIEAGALMLADNGVCCIDEFDKMDQKDQSAIHEAMEQQTISIAKAGIQATLNARTSILAAANPLNGHYDTTRTLKQNVNITPPIMSRFDLYFILVDQPNPESDRCIAKHMISSHLQGVQRTRQTALGALGSSDQAMLNSNIDRYLATVPTRQTHHESIPADKLRAYIRYARQLDPQLSEDARNLIVTMYAEMRQRESWANTVSSYKVTVRQLESLIRLSQACARMYLCSEVSEEHVREAAELLTKSIVNVKPSSSLLGLGITAENDNNDDDDDNDDDDNDFGSFPGGGSKGNGDDDSDDDTFPKKKGTKGDGDDNDDSEDNSDKDGDHKSTKRRRGETATQLATREAAKQQQAKSVQMGQTEATDQSFDQQQVDTMGKKHAITTDEYHRVSLHVLFHLSELRDDKISQMLQTYAVKHNITVSDIPVDAVTGIHHQQFKIIGPTELLVWLQHEDPLKQHADVVFQTSWDKAVQLDEANNNTAATEHIANKKAQYLKKIYKLILRRMMNEDHSIICRNDSVEVHPNYDIQHAVADFGGMDKMALSQRRRDFISDPVYGSEKEERQKVQLAKKLHNRQAQQNSLPKPIRSHQNSDSIDQFPQNGEVSDVDDLHALINRSIPDEENKSKVDETPPTKTRSPRSKRNLDAIDNDDDNDDDEVVGVNR